VDFVGTARDQYFATSRVCGRSEIEILGQISIENRRRMDPVDHKCCGDVDILEPESVLSCQDDTDQQPDDGVAANEDRIVTQGYSGDRCSGRVVVPSGRHLCRGIGVLARRERIR
jgi:hypothetical protein